MCDCLNCHCHSTTMNGPVQIRQLEGRDHFVVHCTMLTEGVHTGSNGPLFYPAQELDRTARLWNGKAVIVYHPSNPSDFSGSPDVFNRHRVGFVFNARMDGIKLVADLWIDVARVQTVDYRIYEAIMNGRRMDVSTGLTSGFMERAGTYNGKPFSHSVIGIMPEHLAILPDMTGACSVADGCGILVNGKPPVLKQDVPVLMSKASTQIPVLMENAPIPKPIKVLKDDPPPRRRKRIPRRRHWL